MNHYSELKENSNIIKEYTPISNKQLTTFLKIIDDDLSLISDKV